MVKQTTSRYRLLFLSALAVVVGVCSGLVAEGLLRTINIISNFCYYGRFSSSPLAPSAAPFHWWFALLPAAGGLLVGLIAHYICHDVRGDGIPAAMSVVLNNKSVVDPRVGVFKPIGAALTVGTGGPFGAEGPILQTGGAIGSTISRLFSCTPSERRTLLACGAAAGLAAVFKTPFAGALLAVELLVCEFKMRSFIPISLAAIIGTLVAIAFRGAGVVFPLQTHYMFHSAELPFFVLLGVLCAGMAWIVQKGLSVSEHFFEHKLKIWFPLIPMLGGLVVGLIALVRPEVLGTGYAVIAELLAKPHSLHLLLGIGFAKLLAFATALGSGASGGTFAPALMIGGSLGAAFGSLVHALIPHSAASIGLYGMVATAALFGSLYRATPSAVLFMLEVTGAFNGLLPLLIVSIVAALVMYHLTKTSINTQKLVTGGQLVPEAYTVDPMRIHRVRDVMTTGGLVPNSDSTVFPDEVLHDVIEKFLHEGIRYSHVVDPETGVIIGSLTAFDILKAEDWEFSQEIREPGLLRLGARA